MLRSKFFYTLATCMAGIVAISNFLVQFPVNYLGLENILTYAAFTYPITFLVTDLANRKYGKIIGISSVIASTGNTGQSNYAASKSGLIGMYKSLALEFAKRNININVVSPGFIISAMTEKLSDNQKNEILSKIPMNRFGNPNDVADLVYFLSSDSSSDITGQNFNINGGMLRP